jgi:hypothetical protein
MLPKVDPYSWKMSEDEWLTEAFTVNLPDVKEDMDLVYRIWLVKTRAIELNVKVRDIAMIVARDKGMLLNFQRTQMNGRTIDKG